MAKSPAPFEATAIKTERTAAAVLMHWMREIIEKERFNLGLPYVETSGADRKMPDLVIFESQRSEKVLCLIEAKPPYFDVFNEPELKEPARKKATQRKAPYFALTNFKQLVWYDTARVNGMASEEEQIVNKFVLSSIEDLNQIENFRRSTEAALQEFLLQLVMVHTGREQIPRLPIDELLIARLHEKIRVLAKQYSDIILERFNEDPKFARELRKWFKEQNWQFTRHLSPFGKAARQTAYLLINKILFYDLLQIKRPNKLDPLEIPQSLTKGSVLATNLQGYFKQVLDIDYETIYDTDFIDSVAFPDSKEVVTEIKDLVRLLRRYDLARLGYDVVGRIFERLIPEDERHNLGQYFTRSEVVDLILRFCLKHENDQVLDPACGAGTFLVRAYQHKKMMNQRLEHEKVLETLWGNDIAKFPAHLATINLAIKDLGSNENYPRILKKDFFSLIVKQDGFDYENSLRGEIQTLSKVKREVKYPRYFDAIVGNPPYTRQEEISKISEGDEEYKETLIERALLDVTDRPLAKIGRRAGIHAYFFVHGFKFLKQGGRFGFIVSESWLDVDYGKGLQEFFLKNYKIVAIIASKIERWFEEADINTCIIILEKCDKKSERDENLCRFVYLKKPLTHFIPPAQEIWEKERGRLQKIDELIRTISGHDVFYENDDLRIYPKSQKELWEEGVEIEEDGGQQHTQEEKKEKYVGSKWGKYLRAPEIFFKILEKGKGKLVPLKQIAHVSFGIKTGANDFFYFTEEDIKREGIEKEFWMHKDENGNWVPNFILHSFRETPSIVIHRDQLKWRILLINEDKKDLKNKRVLHYIRKGEKKKFGDKIPAQTVSCRSRGEKWYGVGKHQPTQIFYPRRIGDRFLIPYSSQPIFCSDNLFPIVVKNKRFIKPLAAFLNSAVTALFNELSGRKLTGAINVVDMDVWMASKILVPDFAEVASSSIKKLIDAFQKLSGREIMHSLKEFCNGKAEVDSLVNVKPDRRELDKIIMGDILGLTEEEQLEVYKAVVDLVRSRIEKAQSVDKGKRYIEGVDVEAVATTVAKQYKEKKKQ